LTARGVITPVALVLAAAVAVAYAYFVDRGQVSDADRSARRRDAFPAFRVEDVGSIEIAHGTAVTLLERETRDAGARTWVMRSPHPGATDLAAVDTLLRELEMAPRVRDVRDDGREADALGLDAPRVRGRISVGRVQYRFELGAEAPRPEGAAYMRIDGEGTFVVGRPLKVQLLRDSDTYRDHAVVPYGASEVARLEVRAPAPAGFTVVRRGASFRVGNDAGLRASRAAMDRLFGALADARADSFVDDEDAAGPPAAAALTVTITPTTDALPRFTMAVGGACPKDSREVVIVRTEPTRLAACIAKHIAEALRTSQAALVDEGPFFAHADEMEDLRLESLESLETVGGGARVDLARRGTGWHERSPEDRDLSADEVDSANALTLALATSRGAGAHAPGRGETFAPVWRATVSRTGGSSPEIVEVAALDAEHGAELRRMDDGAVLHADRALVLRLAPHPVLVRSLAASRVPVDPGAVVAIDDSCTATPERLDLVGGSWKMRPPKSALAGFDVDPVAVADMLSALTRARADAWVAAADDGAFGFAAPASCAVKLTVAADADGKVPSPVGIVFGAEAAGDAQDVNAHGVGDPAIFTAPMVLREIASHPALDRSRFRLDAAALSRVTLVRGGAKVLLVRAVDSPDRLVRAGATQGDAGDDKLPTALSRVYAQSALHMGPAAPAEGLAHPILEIDAVPSADAGTNQGTHLMFGAPVHESAVDGYFARVSGIDATFLVPRQVVDAIVDAW